MRPLLAALFVPMLAGCAVESLRAPEIPAPAAYTTAAPGAGIVVGADIPARWWTLYRSPALDRLVGEALDDSPTLARAAAKLRGAREAMNARQETSRWLFGAGVVLVATGSTLLFFNDPIGPGSRATVTAVPGGAALSMSRVF